MRQMQDFQIRIVSSNNLKTRCYVTFYFKGKRVREYNANSLNLNIKPNYATTIKERNKLLKELEFELLKALKDGTYLLDKADNNILSVSNEYCTDTLLDIARDYKLNDNSLSFYYKKNIKSIHRQFKDFLSDDELKGNITNITTFRIEDFLQRYKSSGVYYMDRRRDLGVLFSYISRQINQPLNMVKETYTMKKKPNLHKQYTREQMLKILEYLKDNHSNLYICCLICYGCFLRPHQEIRLLRGRHFVNDFTEIRLAPDENKSGRVRVVPIPNYVREAIMDRVSTMSSEDNLFTLNSTTYNLAYFNTQWKRIWNKMFEIGLVERNQTIYSFRHTGAIMVYKKTKDVSVVQKLLGHSDMIVTLTYLRGLGELNNDNLRDLLPEL